MKIIEEYVNTIVNELKEEKSDTISESLPDDDYCEYLKATLFTTDPERQEKRLNRRISDAERNKNYILENYNEMIEKGKVAGIIWKDINFEKYDSKKDKIDGIESIQKLILHFTHNDIKYKIQISDVMLTDENYVITNILFPLLDMTNRKVLN